MPMLPFSPRGLSQLQRVLLVALLTPALLLMVLATVPALAVLPFLTDGTSRTAKLLQAHAATASALLRGSRGEATPPRARGGSTPRRPAPPPRP